MRETEVKTYYYNTITKSKEYYTEKANLVQNETIVILAHKCKDCVLLAQKDYSSLECGSLEAQVVCDLLYHDEKGFQKVLRQYGFSGRYRIMGLDKTRLDSVNNFVSKFDDMGWEVILRKDKGFFYLETSEVEFDKVEKFSASKIEKVFL